jgi:predicted AlkP superfamily phosphohydrolase/phosphomutase
MSEGGCRVFVIGLDGATLEVIVPLVEAGRLPTFARLMREGAYGTLLSTIPATSPPAWTTFMTGKKACKHGIFDFLTPGRDGHQRHYVNATDIRSSCVWDVLEVEGKRVGLVEIPMTFPPRPVQGFMLSGMMTPSSDVVFTYPSHLQSELILELGDFTLETTFLQGIRPRDMEELIRRLSVWTESRRRAVLYLMDRYPWDFFMVVFRGTDIIQHYGCRFDDQMTRERFPLGAEKYGLVVDQYYEKIDRVCEEILDRMDDRTIVVFMSDHGGGSVNRYFWINRLLFEEGYLKLKGDSFSTAKYQLSRIPFERVMSVMGWSRGVGRLGRIAVPLLRRRLCEGEELIDWKRTRAYGNWRGVGECINLNVRGREPWGMVDQGAEAEDLRQELTDRLLSLRDPETGLPVIERVYRREELYSGPYANEAPDLLLTTHSKRCCLRRELLPGLVFTTPVAAHGAHRREGILFLSGPNVRAGVRLEEAGLADVVPTILYLMGLPVPEDMDGAVLTGAIDDEHLRSHPILFRAPVEWRPGKKVVYTRDEVVRLEDALRGLGYVD